MLRTKVASALEGLTGVSVHDRCDVRVALDAVMCL